jgi:hypothetical protein
MPRVVCDGNGFVRGFPYHDGRLDGVLVSDCGTEVCLALRDTADGRRVLTLRHVSALHVDGFRQGNIVLNLRTVAADQVGCDEELSRIVRERLFIKPETLPTSEQAGYWLVVLHHTLNKLTMKWMRRQYIHQR